MADVIQTKYPVEHSKKYKRDKKISREIVPNR